MKYMGSKNRIAKELLPIILKDRKEGQWYVEPFVGGGNMIDKVSGNRAGFDYNAYLIEALKLIRDNPQSIPDLITEDDYKKLKDKKELNGITGFTGFAMSFGGKWFGGYRRDVAGSKGCIENMKTQTRRSKQNAIKQSTNLKGVYFNSMSYLDLTFKNECVIYCDPPYENTTKYSNSFNHLEFWEWCRVKTKEGHQVFISEYNAPKDFECVWSKELSTTLGGSKKDIEKLFVFKND